MTSKPAVLCDFDGTISKGDIGSTLFRRFAGGADWEDLIASWLRGEIGSKECLTRECRLIRVTREQVVELAESFEIDEYFHEFADWCAAEDIPLAVVSDGLDFYIEVVLRKHGLSHLPVFANHLKFNETGIEPEFPYFGLGCESCGNCKGYHVRRYRERHGRVVFVGDGYSDRCALEDSDLVLAKGDLARLCREEGKTCASFRDFRDVRRLVEDACRRWK
ncbi:MAG: MtnX-like HAD-IB family phosphatase [Candidatus Eisenbacteria bacterium]|nr:MtnX-like HAD-IB family phosphatase [Candidatus Eisenbacteria bacterium]